MKQPLYRFRLEQQLLGLIIFGTFSKHSIEKLQMLACNILSYKSFTNWNESPFNRILINHKIRFTNHIQIFKTIQHLQSKGIVADNLHIYDYLLKNDPDFNSYEFTIYIGELALKLVPMQEPECMMLLFEQSLIDFYDERISTLIKNEPDILKRTEWAKIYDILNHKELDILTFVDTLPVLLERIQLFAPFEIQEFHQKKKEISNRCKVIADAVNRFNYSLRNVEFRKLETVENVSQNPPTENSNTLPPIAPF